MSVTKAVVMRWQLGLTSVVYSRATVPVTDVSALDSLITWKTSHIAYYVIVSCHWSLSA